MRIYFIIKIQFSGSSRKVAISLSFVFFQVLGLRLARILFSSINIQLKIEYNDIKVGFFLKFFLVFRSIEYFGLERKAWFQTISANSACPNSKNLAVCLQQHQELTSPRWQADSCREALLPTLLLQSGCEQAHFRSSAPMRIIFSTWFPFSLLLFCHLHNCEIL